MSEGIAELVCTAESRVNHYAERADVRYTPLEGSVAREQMIRMLAVTGISSLNGAFGRENVWTCSPGEKSTVQGRQGSDGSLMFMEEGFDNWGSKRHYIWYEGDKGPEDIQLSFWSFDFKTNATTDGFISRDGVLRAVTTLRGKKIPFRVGMREIK